MAERDQLVPKRTLDLNSFEALTQKLGPLGVGDPLVKALLRITTGKLPLWTQESRCLLSCTQGQ